jgi:hypothetical protein
MLINVPLDAFTNEIAELMYDALDHSLGAARPFY